MDLKQAIKLLKIEKLKYKQEKIITKLVDKKKNIIGVLPTGYGKTICYLIPHLMSGKNTIVISPLISLMDDQIKKLEKYKIPYLCFTSIHNKTQSNLNKVRNGSLNAVLYFSPESFFSRQLIIKSLIAKDKVGLICIDESHCLTTWKHFREKYSQLSVLQKWISGKKIPILCLTATATNDSIKSMMKNIKLTKATIVKGSFEKKQHYIDCCLKDGLDTDVKKMVDLIRLNKGKTIIYCKTRNETEKISKKLNLKGVKSDYYHAQIRGNTRLEIANNFSHGNLDVMTATIAFGMGIDIPNIYLVIHYGISVDIESYYQEIGRGGRDGAKTKCVVFWNKRDFIINKFHENKITNLDERASLHKKSLKIRDYLETQECRQVYICNYFQETINKCNKCDNCFKTLNQDNIEIMTSYIIFKELPKYNAIAFGILVNKLFTKTSLKKIGKYNIKILVNNLINKNYLIENLNNINLEIKHSEKSEKWMNANKKNIDLALIKINSFLYQKRGNYETLKLLSMFKI